MFGEALNDEIANQMVAHFNAERGKIIGEAQSCPQEIIDILNSSLETLLQKVGKKEKPQKEKKPKKKSAAQKKKDLGIRKRFQYKGNDQKGANGAFLRIRVDRETRLVSMINEANWSPKSKKKYAKVYGTGPAYIIPAGAGKKAQIVATKPYKKTKKVSA